MLRLYASRLDAQERAYVAALDDQPRRERLAAYVADRVMGNIVEETLAAGPPPPPAAGGGRLRPRGERRPACLAHGVRGQIGEKPPAAGPAALVEAARERFARGGLDQSVRR